MNIKNLLTSEPRRKVFEAVLATKGPFTINQIVSTIQDDHVNYSLVRDVLQGLTRRGFLVENTARNPGVRTGGRPKATFEIVNMARFAQP